MWGLISKDIYLTILKGMWILSQGLLFVTEEEPWLGVSTDNSLSRPRFWKRTAGWGSPQLLPFSLWFIIRSAWHPLRWNCLDWVHCWRLLNMYNFHQWRADISSVAHCGVFIICCLHKGKGLNMLWCRWSRNVWNHVHKTSLVMWCKIWMCTFTSERWCSKCEWAQVVLP